MIITIMGFEAIASLFGGAMTALMGFVLFALNGMRSDQRETNKTIQRTNELLTKEIRLNGQQSEILNAHEHRIEKLESRKR